MRQAIGAKQTMITVFFTARKLIVFDVLPKRDQIESIIYFINCIFPILKRVLGMLKGIPKDRELHSNDEIEVKIASWNDLTFNDVHSVFHNWTSSIAQVIKNDREYTLG
jgi:hypothetical protein